MAHLRDLDEVAYVRFASVYRNFREAKDFEPRSASCPVTRPRIDGERASEPRAVAISRHAPRKAVNQESASVRWRMNSWSWIARLRGRDGVR